MGRARPLLLAMNAQRWREEERENQRAPGVIPDGERGLILELELEMMGRGFWVEGIILFFGKK